MVSLTWIPGIAFRIYGFKNEYTFPSKALNTTRLPETVTADFMGTPIRY